MHNNRNPHRIGLISTISGVVSIFWTKSGGPSIHNLAGIVHTLFTFTFFACVLILLNRAIKTLKSNTLGWDEAYFFIAVLIVVIGYGFIG